MVSQNTRFVTPILIGRESELQALGQGLLSARQGAGSCLLLAGEPGIGKSRLIAELCGRARSEQFVILQGHCFEQDIAFPYAPWIDALRACFARQTASEINELLGPLAPEFVKLLPELSLLIPQIQPTPVLELEAEKGRRFESLARLVASLTRVNPLLIVLEDLHWSDELSLELLHFLARRIADLPVLLVGTFRTETASARLGQHLIDLNRERLAQEIRLSPLARTQVEQMVRATLNTDHVIADSLLDLLDHLAEGNPFIVEEILEALIQVGSLSERQGRWELKSGVGLHVPRNLQDAVQQRTRRLPENARHLLTVGAVVGQRFDVGLLQAVTQQAEPQLLQGLKDLIGAQFIVEESPDQFAFRHALTREAVYAIPLLRERRALHTQIGENMERLWGSAGGPPAAELAYHFEQAAVWDKTLAYAQQAGEQAQKLHAPREALAHFSRALEAAERLKRTPASSILRGRAHALELLGEFDRARADFEAALEAARREQDRMGEWARLIDLGSLWQSRDWVRAGDYFERALDLARTLEETALIAQSLNRIGNWHANRAQPREALSAHQQALELFRALNDRRGLAQTLELMGIASYHLGEIVQGMAYCEQAVPILHELDDRQSLFHALSNLCLPAHFDTEVLGDIEVKQLAGPGEMALDIARRSNYRKGEADALANVATCLCRAGDYGRGLEYLRRASSIAEEIGHRELLTTVHVSWGIELYLGLLAAAEARGHLETAHAVAQQLGSIALTFMATALLVRVCILQKDLARAQGLLDALLPAELPGVTDMTMLERICWAARAELELALGKPGRGLEIIERLLAGTANLQAYGPYAVPYLSWLRGKALAAVGRIDEAASEFAGAIGVARSQGQRLLLWRLHVDLGKAFRAAGRRAEAEAEFSSGRTIIQEAASTLPEGALRDHFLSEALKGIPGAPALTPRRAAMKEYGGLSERERQVATLIAQGKSNLAIAKTLVISVRTVEAHITRILDKLGFASRAEIAVWAAAKGLAPPSE